MLALGVGVLLVPAFGAGGVLAFVLAALVLLAFVLAALVLAALVLLRLRVPAVRRVGRAVDLAPDRGSRRCDRPGAAARRLLLLVAGLGVQRVGDLIGDRVRFDLRRLSRLRHLGAFVSAAAVVLALDSRALRLHHVRQLVGDQSIAFLAPRRVLARVEVHVAADGECARAEAAGRLRCGASGVHAHARQIGAELGLHLLAHAIGQRRAARLRDVHAAARARLGLAHRCHAPPEAGRGIGALGVDGAHARSAEEPRLAGHALGLDFPVLVRRLRRRAGLPKLIPRTHILECNRMADAEIGAGWLRPLPSPRG